MAAVLSPAEFAHALKSLEDPKAWRKELRRLHRKVANAATKYSRAEMRSGSDRFARQLAASAKYLRANANTTGAALVISNRQWAPMLVAVWGTKKKLGWYGGWTKDALGYPVWDPQIAAGFEGGKPNAAGWIGNNWTVATRGQGPRGINDALAKHQGDLLDIAAQESMDLIARAFPRSGGNKIKVY